MQSVEGLGCRSIKLRGRRSRHEGVHFRYGVAPGWFGEGLLGAICVAVRSSPVFQIVSDNNMTKIDVVSDTGQSISLDAFKIMLRFW